MTSTEQSRGISIIATVIVLFTLICIAGRIISYGYLPPDDALRHAAKAVSGKTWPEILVLRPGFTIDPSPGWDAILTATHRLTNWSTETLVAVPVAALMALVGLAGLCGLKRSECWLVALLAVAIFSPTFIGRLALGRPFLVTMSVYLVLLTMWARQGLDRPGPAVILLTIILIAAAAWIHGSFYQLILPAAGLLLAGRWRQSLWYGALWAVGSFLGACFTGHPFVFLIQCVRHLFDVFGDYTLSRQLVAELTPTDGQPLMALAVIAMLLWRSRSPGWKARDLREPVFVMALLGWALGLKVARFWWEWGMPAAMLWLALQTQAKLEECIPAGSIRRLGLTLALAGTVFLAITGDHGNRWTWNATKQYLSADDPSLSGWMPEKGGILYSIDMSVFEDTFFKNPHAPWRYILGFESGLMPREDLDVLRRIEWNGGDLRGYEPWIKKMRPEDRLILTPDWLPADRSMALLPELEWRYAPNGWWIGRLKTRR